MTGWDAWQHELDVTKNHAMYPVFQRTLQTNATKAIVLKQETTGCTSRETWNRIIKYFRTSIHHQNTKGQMKQKIYDHKAHLWKNQLSSFIFRFEELITNYNEVADTGEIILDPKKKELLCKSILGHPDLLAVKISDKTYSRVPWKKNVLRSIHACPVFLQTTRATEYFAAWCLLRGGALAHTQAGKTKPASASGEVWAHFRIFQTT